MRRLLLILPLLLIGGCAYYKVTDKSSGNVYYTKYVRFSDKGTKVQFKSAVNDQRVLLDSADVVAIPRKQFKAGTEPPATDATKPGS